MVAEDLPEVMAIERASFASPWTEGMFLHEMEVPFSRLFVVRTSEESRELIGYVSWWVVAGAAEIHDVAVRSDYRRRGVGNKLVQLVIDDARATRASSVSLEVERENLPARRLYESFGFGEVGLRRSYYGHAGDAVIMTLVLPG
jgi:ribosomal-protein-alanine N-acetyltransferase